MGRTWVQRTRADARPPRDDADVLNVEQAAALLYVNPQTIRIWADEGKIPCFRVGTRKDRRFHRADVEKLRGTR